MPELSRGQAAGSLASCHAHPSKRNYHTPISFQLATPQLHSMMCANLPSIKWLKINCGRGGSVMKGLLDLYFQSAVGGRLSSTIFSLIISFECKSKTNSDFNQALVPDLYLRLALASSQVPSAAQLILVSVSVWEHDHTFSIENTHKFHKVV